MNIVLVVYSYYSSDARVRRYAESLARSGYKVDVICLKENYKPKEKNIRLIQYPFQRKRLNKFWYLAEYFLFTFCSFCILTFNHASKKYKLIHINNMPDFLVFSALIPRLFGAKVILDMHDPMPELYMSKYNKTQKDLIIKLLKYSELLSLKLADHIITANSIFLEIFLKRNTIPKEKIDVILNCPDPRLFYKKTKPGNKANFTLFYGGTVEERFGLDVALEAIPQILPVIPNLKLTIIPKLENEGRYFDGLKKKIKVLNLHASVFIESPVPLEHISEKLLEANVGIVLAKKSVFTQIILPVKLLEFIAMDIPVIATKTEMLDRYFTNKQVFFLFKNTPQEFANAVLELHRNKKLKQSLIKNARKYFETNNWNKESKKYLRIVNRLIAAS